MTRADAVSALFALRASLLEENQGSECSATEAIAVALNVMAEPTHPVALFVEMCCELNTGASIPCSELFAAWVGWNASQGREASGTIQVFGRDLSRLYPQIRPTQPRTGGVQRERHYRGLRLKPA